MNRHILQCVREYNENMKAIKLNSQEDALPNGLSVEAKAVLEKACDICRKTFEFRPLFDQTHPEYQINNWDCGWYQIKALAKEYAPEDMDEFSALYKALSEKMRPMVYTLGFLKGSTTEENGFQKVSDTI